jgi:hypothetical protein
VSEQNRRRCVAGAEKNFIFQIFFFRSLAPDKIALAVRLSIIASRHLAPYYSMQRNYAQA